MKNLNLILSAFVLFFLSIGKASPIEPLVNGGTPVTDGDPIAQSTVMLDMGYGTCSGTLISNDIVLTAAHCLSDEPDKVEILFQGYESKVTAVSSVYAIHEKYDLSSNGGVDDFDIALVQFKGGLPKSFLSAKILPTSESLPAGMPLTIAGYGKGGPVGVLNKLDLLLLPFTESHTQIKLAQTAAHSACFGDSGGPAYRMLKGELFVTGVGSYVDAADCSGFVVYTKPQSYLSWIASTSKVLRTKK